MSASLPQRKTILTDTPPKAHMGITATKHTVVMHFPSLIKRSCVSTDTLTSYPDAIVGEKNEMAFAGFKYLNLSELSALDFSTQNLHDWVTHTCISPTLNTITHSTGLLFITLV